jgi:prevent-host-death family protein
MKNKKFVSISEARKNIFEMAEEVQKPGIFFTLTEKGVPKAVLLSYDQFDDLLDDLDLYSDPGLQKRIQKAQREINSGNYVTLEELKKELGYVENEVIMVKERNGARYAPRPKSKKKSPKN